MKYHTTPEQLDALHAAQDKTRSTSKTVKVDRQALINLLMDHGTMSHRIEGLER